MKKKSSSESDKLFFRNYSLANIIGDLRLTALGKKCLLSVLYPVYPVVSRPLYNVNRCVIIAATPLTSVSSWHSAVEKSTRSRPPLESLSMTWPISQTFDDNGMSASRSGTQQLQPLSSTTEEGNNTTDSIVFLEVLVVCAFILQLLEGWEHGMGSRE